jgi:hypothetical protein
VSNVIFVEDNDQVVTASELLEIYESLDENVNAVARYFDVHPMKIWRKLREFGILTD